MMSNNDNNSTYNVVKLSNLHGIAHSAIFSLPIIFLFITCKAHQNKISSIYECCQLLFKDESPEYKKVSKYI